MPPPKLSPELVSLIHHVELNKAGWWDHALQRLVLGAIWLAQKPISIRGLAPEFRTHFGIDIPTEKLQRHVRVLSSSGTVVEGPSGVLNLSQVALEDFERQLEETEELEEKAKAKFEAVLCDCCPELSPHDAWRSFHDLCLLPVVREMGALTYEVASGTHQHLDKAQSFSHFLDSYKEEARAGIRRAVIAFLDPKDLVVRSYVLRQLNAFFFLEASNLADSTIQSLTKSSAQQVTFNLFIDTNFLFSILGLHDNPSNEAAQSLMGMVSQLSGRLSVRLYLLPVTMDETKRVLRSQQEMLGDMALTPNLATAASEFPLSGIAHRFIQQAAKAPRSVTVGDYFGPYLANLVQVIRGRGLDLYNENVDRLKTEQHVIDDIMHQLEWEKQRFGTQAKSYEALEHDMVLWHFVKDKRPAQVDSVADAKFWIVTIDYHLLGFDLSKLGKDASGIRLCVHPAVLIQLLQLWVPRTSLLEEAVVSSLRLPFLFSDFDPQAERATIRILQALSRFEGVGDLSEETVRTVLIDQALRQKMSAEPSVEAQIEIVREAVLSESAKVRKELDEVQAENRALRKQLSEKTEAAEETRKLLQEHETKMADSQAKLESERTQRESLEARLHELEGFYEAQKERAEARRQARRFVVRSTLPLLLLCSVLAIIAPIAIRAHRPMGHLSLDVATWTLIALGALWALDRRGSTEPVVKQWPPFARFHKLRRKLFVVLGGLLIAMLAHALYDLILWLVRA